MPIRIFVKLVIVSTLVNLDDPDHQNLLEPIMLNHTVAIKKCFGCCSFKPE